MTTSEKSILDGHSTATTIHRLKRAWNKITKIVIIMLCGIILTILSLMPVPSDAYCNWMSADGIEASYMGFTFWRQKCRPSRALSSTVATKTFDWGQVSPSAELNWVECYSDYQCARLQVPLDYGDPEGEKAAVALLRLRAKLPPDSETYLGPVLFNPGGPGGSGVSTVLTQGKLFQQLLGHEYDIVGFDPRGVGETTPTVSPFSDQYELAYWLTGTPSLANSTSDSLPRSVSRAQLFNELIASKSARAAQHVSTTIVARDMFSIMKAHGREKLQYWGFSYGSLLGATYAAMFPDSVERLVIDGVVDYDDYYSGEWSTNLYDTDKILQLVYDKCAETVACPLHANSSALVQQRIEAIFASIKAKPVAAISGDDYGLIDFTKIKIMLFQSLHRPFTVVPRVLAVMSDLEKGDGRQAIELWKLFEKVPKCNASSGTPPDGSREAGIAVACSDAKKADHTLEEITEHFKNLSRISIFADIWTDLTYTVCSGWKVPPKERFSGPFSKNTSFPLLIIGNTADPVTPLRGARKASQTFGNSVLLTVNTPGHCSVAATSPCSNKVIRAYFREGALPEEGTVCEIEDILFGEQQHAAGQNSEDAWLFDVSRSLSSSFHVSRGSFPL